MLSQDTVRHQACINCPGQREHVNSRGTGFQQSLGTLVDRRPGRKDIVDQEHAPAGENLCVVYCESPPKIARTLRASQRRLRNSGAYSDKSCGHNREVEVTAKEIREQQRLVEFSLAQPTRMERNRHNQITINFRGEGTNHQCGEGVCQSRFPAILEGTDRILEWRKIWEESPGSFKGRRLP